MAHVCQHHDHHLHLESTPSEWLKMHEIRVTDQRCSMIDFLRKNKQPVTLAEIHQGIKKSGSDFATVFRFIQLLEEKNLVQQHYWEDNQIRYEIHEGHHHYLICRSCRHIQPIEECLLSSMEKKLIQSSGYAGLTHRLEFFGTCPTCQKKNLKN